jgi:hypothetical protein
MPILVRCPRAGDGYEHRYPSADQVIAVARRINRREVTHYQGRAERRTRWNTPVQGLVMFLNDATLDVPGRRVLAGRAKERCGKLGLATSAVTFHDSLSPVCCQIFSLFVTMGSRALDRLRGITQPASAQFELPPERFWPRGRDICIKL